MTKILLVEDDKSLREIYGVRLLAEGYDIVSAGDGEEALAMSIKDRPDLIVSDVMMPKISGFDMLDILRSTTETKNIKVIMMTALSSEDQRQRGVALGADRYLVKSQVGIEDVVRAVHEVLGDAVIGSTATTTTATPTSQTPPVIQPISIPTPQPYVAPTTPVRIPVLNSAPRPMPQSATPPPAPTPQPYIAPPPATPISITVAQPPDDYSTTLPQPTAPFSTARPASLGDRIIHPLVSAEPVRDFGHLMTQELADSTPSPTPNVPAPASVPQPATTYLRTDPQAGISPADGEASGIGFEETPRSSTPTTAPSTPTPPVF